MNVQRSDAILMEVLREHKSVTGFLDAVFSFLRRNTDFYHIKSNKLEKIGFPKGLREKIVLSCLQHFDPECQQSVDKKQILQQDFQEPEICEDVPFAIDEVELELESSAPEIDINNSSKLSKKNGLNEKSVFQENIFSPSDYKNGACFQNYCWSQTIKDVELHIKLPPNLHTSKSLVVNIKSNSILVTSKNNPKEVVLSGNLSEKCRHNESIWTISESKLHISFDKIVEIWWEKLFMTEDCIDTTKVDSECYIDELPEQSQAEIHKLRVQQMKQDSQEEFVVHDPEMLERLRKGWDAEGSPFKGQPFDPSMVKPI